jgi:hypothetical protein
MELFEEQLESVTLSAVLQASTGEQALPALLPSQASVPLR